MEQGYEAQPAEHAALVPGTAVSDDSLLPVVVTEPLGIRSEPSRRRFRRPSAATIGCVVAAILVVTVGAIAFASYRNGESWRHRSRQWQSRAARLTSSLHQSEQDAQSLQTRLDGLANEKAQAQDERNAAEVQRNTYQAVSVLASQAASDLESCRRAVSTTLSATISQLGSQYVDWPSLESLAGQSDTLCNTAQQTYQRLASAVGAL